MPGDFIWAGNTQIWIKGYGSIHLNLRSAKGNQTIRLDNVAYCPNLLCNLVSFRLLRKQGLWWDTKADPTTLKRRDNTVLAELQELYGQWVLEYRTANRVTTNTAFAMHKNNTSKRRKFQKADAITWHKQMGHLGPQALEHLVQQS